MLHVTDVHDADVDVLSTNFQSAWYTFMNGYVPGHSRLGILGRSFWDGVRFAWSAFCAERRVVGDQSLRSATKVARAEALRRRRHRHVYIYIQPATPRLNGTSNDRIASTARRSTGCSTAS